MLKSNHFFKMEFPKICAELRFFQSSLLKYLAEIDLFFSKFFVFLRIFSNFKLFSQNKFKLYLNFHSVFKAVSKILS